MPFRTPWTIFRLRPLLKDLRRIADSLDLLATIADREFPPPERRRPKRGSVSAGHTTMLDRAAQAAAERTLRSRLGRDPTDDEVVDLLDEVKRTLGVFRSSSLS